MGPHTPIPLSETGVKFAMDVRELDIDLIDRINPFGEAYKMGLTYVSIQERRELDLPSWSVSQI